MKQVVAFFRRSNAPDGSAGPPLCLRRMVCLDLSRNQLGPSVPQDLARMTGLTRLWLNDNKLERLPKAMGALDRLVELNLARNVLADIPSEFGGLTRLEKLDFRFLFCFDFS